MENPPANTRHSQISRREQTWELMDMECTTALITQLKLPAHTKNVIYERAKTCSRRRPMLVDLRDSVDLPVYICVDARKELREEGSLANLFPVERFQRSKLMQRFWETRESTSSERGDTAFATLIKWPYLSQPMVMHTCPYDRTSPGLRIFLTTPDKPAVTLEPLDQFVNHVLLPKMTGNFE